MAELFSDKPGPNLEPAQQAVALAMTQLTPLMLAFMLNDKSMKPITYLNSLTAAITHLQRAKIEIQAVMRASENDV